VLLNLWATWCGPCKVEIPWFSEFEAKYRDRGFAVLGVAMDDDGWTSVLSYLEKMKMSYRVMIGDDTLAQRYGGIDSLPETLLIDRDGKIAAQHVGLTGKSNYEDEIVQLLGSNRSPGTMLKFAFTLALAALACSAADLVGDVRSSAEQSDFTRANGCIRSYEAQRGQTPESILALSWMARTALAQKKYDQADRYAQDTYQRVQKELKKRPLDREPDLPLALGASIEVQAQVLAAKSQRTEAVSMLEVELKKYSATSIHARIQKNINLLSLEGKPAPPLKGVSLPKGKPALVFFWAHWCGDCRAEAPILAQLKKEYGPKGLVFVGPTQKYGYIGANENVPPGVELPYIEKIRQTYYSGVVDGPAVVSEQNFLNYGVSTTPTLALVDRRGIVRLYHPGELTHQELRSAIEGVLQRP
jgi:thiol-disulfide isomerase/thioredoxin